MKNLFVALAIVVGAGHPALTADVVSVPRWTPHDFSFAADTTVANPFATELDVVIVGPGGTSFVLPGFFDGNGTWKVRVAPAVEGEWSLRTNSDIDALNGKTAVFTCVANHNPNNHGMLKVYQEQAQPFTLDIAGAKSKLSGEWFNAFTGQRTAAGDFENGMAKLSPPKEWPDAPLVLHLKPENVKISGETKQWHAVTLTLDGPQASETDIDPNPYLDNAFSVTFAHESGAPAYTVPGYFAADGNAGQAIATSGNQWRAHLSPDKTGIWNYQIRKYALWATLMAGGAGIEYYFGMKHPENNINCEDWRSREQTWRYARIAREWFVNNKIPFWEMQSSNALVDNLQNDNTRYCFSKPRELYIVYLPEGGTSSLDLTGVDGKFKVAWFNPRVGGDTSNGSIVAVVGGNRVELGLPPHDTQEDWLVSVRRE